MNNCEIFYLVIDFSSFPFKVSVIASFSFFIKHNDLMIPNIMFMMLNECIN